ncbi:MAG: BlaI/MecI/CopY family transcriptional regulator [Proteiniphilum sp.]|jgi:predicted transcriptional regulator|nr:BlaI/MecI/CopY family transcriptional regulator [Proteiniphilum sp.]MDD2937369.1 BlaI/MecI/CopY family transcriptional regulator [Proteiniphilum sp.]MDD3075272.1 BlaI/MecI/CopY family transcriptional regulator [Proteiniphilum sp.]MDD3778765.1 BlaI/MecI/CopY family transcriptional regulator [Proteiniphilum sp.]
MHVVKELTIKEEEVMNLFWEEGPLFVKQLVEKYPDPKPHFNTLSTYVRSLEEKGYLSHDALGSTYRYFPVITEEQYRNGNLKNVVRKYFDNSYLHVVSSLIKENDITVEEIRKLLEEVEKTNDKK